MKIIKILLFITSFLFFLSILNAQESKKKCRINNNKQVIAKGGRYDELVRFFSPNEKTLNGIGFTISIDVLRNLIKDEKKEKKKILLMFKDSYLLEKGMNEQKELQKSGNIAVLHLNPCDDLAKANQIMKENNCTEILWVK